MAEEAGREVGEDGEPEVNRIYCSTTDETAWVPSTITWCADCRRELWISNNMRPRVDSGELKPSCRDCMAKRVDEIDEIRLAPEQYEALEEMGILPAVISGLDQLNAEIKDWQKDNDDDQRT